MNALLQSGNVLGLSGRRWATLFLAIVMLTGCTMLPAGRTRNAPAANEATPTPIPTPVVPTKPTYQVQKGEVLRQLLMNGRIAPVQEKQLYFRINGRVRRVYVKAKDTVKAGQVLADMEIDNLERELTAGQLELDRVQARLKSAEDSQQENIAKADANLAIAKENLAIIRTQNPAPKKVQAEVALKKAQLNLDRAQADYDAIAWREDKGASAQAANLQQVTLTFTEAKATYDLAIQAIATYQHQVNIAEKQVELQQINLDSLKRGVDPMVLSDLKRAELTVAKLQAAVEDGQLIAPFDGQILDSVITEGRAAEAYKPMITLANPDSLEVRVDSSTIKLDELQEGMTTTVTLLGRPGVELVGTIRRLPNQFGTTTKAETEDDKSMRISVTETPAQANYQLGDLTRVLVILERKPTVLWLPPAAVRTFEGRKFVVLQENNGQRRVDVKVGIEGEDRIEIASGLTEGQVVVGQ